MYCTNLRNLKNIVSLSRATLNSVSSTTRQTYVNSWTCKRYLSLSGFRFKDSETIEIGGVVKQVKSSKNWELIPSKYLTVEPSQGTLKQLKWMIQKDELGQDIFLIGPPGPSKLRLATSFAELIRQEVEYIALSRDTTESDLKQRREIKGGTAFFQDQAAVRAAIHGRLLILDGIEKAERNVLPVLNNLLENREMPLEDGRFLISSSRYDKLVEESSAEELEKWKLVRVDEKFRVVSLGLPVPKYVGHPLDPPLRSRFQALNVGPKTFKEQMIHLREIAPGAKEEQLILMASFAYAVNSPESKNLGLPDFPVDSLPLGAILLGNNPNLTVDEVLYRLYPYKTFLTKDGQKMVQDLMSNLSIGYSDSERIKSIPEEEPTTTHYVRNDYHDTVVDELMESNRVHDLCLIGPKGCGKSTVVKRMAERLSLDIEPIMLYQDMTARDLLQQRSTLANGDTIWRPSPLLNAAMEGKIAVMDGLHRLNSGTLFTIQSLIHEREAQLFDGSRILRHDRYDDIKQQLNASDQDMADRKLFRMHPDFRIVALAEPPSSSGKSNTRWLTPEILSMFLYHTLRPLQVKEEIRILEKLICGSLPQSMKPVIDLAQRLRNANDPTLNNLASSLSTRQLLRIAKRLKEYPSSDAYELVERACLSRFLPRLANEALVKAMERSGLEKKETQSDSASLQCSVHDGMLTIGQTSTPLYQAGNQAKVPDVVFYDNPQHIRILESLLQDFLLGDHLLLVGNQGVGKNRLIDRLLALMNRPREYIQLHRDTTVQSLTVQPTVHNGIVMFQDSPLVRAARDGSILVVDEADKAPTQVTCILKTLVENGEMLLADGRRILSPGVHTQAPESEIIRLHPDFRMIVLANRPGFPFLGNDFFASLGDVFGVHAVENPSLESELQLLRNYGPNVPEAILRQLVQSFSQLRSMADQGQLTYPYSTREVINIVKHLERYPKDGIVRVVSNVFDFDAYNPEAKETITRVFHQHGIPLGASIDNVALAQELPLSDPVSGGRWQIMEPTIPSATQKDMSFAGKFTIRVDRSSLAPAEARLLWFTEEKQNWKLDFGEVQNLQALSARDGVINVLTTSPAMLFSLNTKTNDLFESHLDRYLDAGYYAASAGRFQMANLNDSVLIYDSETGKLLLVDVPGKNVRAADLKGSSSSLGRLSQKWMGKSTEQEKLLLAATLPDFNSAIFYPPGGSRLDVVDLSQMNCQSYELGVDIHSIYPVGQDRVVINQPDGRKCLFKIDSNELRCVNESQPLDRVTSEMIQAQNDVLFTVRNHYVALMAIPENQLKLWPGLPDSDDGKVALLPKNNLVVRSVSSANIPNSVKKDHVAGFLQVADLNRDKLRFIPYPKMEERRRYGAASSKTLPWLQTPLDEDHLVTVDNNGRIKLWEINAAALAQSLNIWRTAIGDEGDVQLTVKRPVSGDLSGPKVGKVDPKNTPHVGGNQWAGGTGGRDTAGLGGRGGPYRLDAGHTVHQVSDEEKAAVPEEIQRAAREMGRKAYKERLNQIKMDPLDAELYQQFSSSVQKQVRSLRVILESLQAKGKEREWMKHQTYGDLDDGKIIEGLTGERNIYRRRAEREPELGTPLVKPKHFRFLVDASGSMYRFNGYDKRLERQMAAVLLFMEALEGHSSKWRYDIIAHSGETVNLELVNSQRPPQNEKERFDVLLNLHAHSQFCMSGDHTLEATRQSITSLSEATDIDEAFVIVLSDANLERYGIPASHLARALTATDNVRAAAVFIGSLGDQAARLSQQMPAGSAYVCMDLEQLPQILQQIFTSVLLSS